MVNQKTAKIKIVLNLLESSDTPVSGESIASALGVSRVAVWKIISGMKDDGYIIEATHSGYRILSSTDKPLPWEVDSAHDLIEYHHELDSTMHKASILIDADCADGTCIIAGSQTAGQTANGGNWNSPDGGLYLTRIRRRPFPAIYSGLYTVALASAVVELLRDKYSVKAFISWPGSIFINHKKIGGVMTDFKGRGDIITSIAAGIGLNLSADKQLPPDAAALSDFTADKVSMKKTTSLLLRALESRDKEFPAIRLESIYTNLIREAGKKAKVRKSDGSLISGTIAGLHESGALIIETSTEHNEYIFTGDRVIYE